MRHQDIDDYDGLVNDPEDDLYDDAFDGSEIDDDLFEEDDDYEPSEEDFDFDDDDLDEEE